MQLLSCLNDWTSCLDVNVPVDVCYFDVAKAFDTVCHPLLLAKLEAFFGISGSLLGWIRAWLSSRKQFVSVGDSFSSYADVSSGVPQGSVLGPILFVLFINDLPSCVRFSKIFLFADDVKLYLQVKSDADFDQLQSDILTVPTWFSDNLLSVAAPKCKIFHLCSRFNLQYQ